MHLSPGVRQAEQGAVATALVHSETPSGHPACLGVLAFPFLGKKQGFRLPNASEEGHACYIHAVRNQILPSIFAVLGHPVPPRSTSQVSSHLSWLLRAK